MPENNKQALQLILSFVFAAALLLGTLPAAADGSLGGQWEPVGEDEGVALYRAVNESKGMLPFKAVALLDVPYEKIVMALVDAERKPDWAPKLKATAIHKEISPNHFEYSEYYTTPWPFMDREFLLLGTVSYENDSIIFSAENSKNRTLSRTDHLTANIQDLTFAITPVSRTRTRVTFVFSGDLGGWIPSFVKTIIQRRWPVRFIQALQKYVTENHELETERYLVLKKRTITLHDNTDGF